MAGSDQPLSFIMPEKALDKIFYATPPDSFIAVPQNGTPLSPSYTTVTIPQETGGTVFVDAQVSADNFTWYDAGYEPFYSSGAPVGYFRRFILTWNTTSTAINLRFSANDAAYNLYYRAVAYYKV